MIRDRVRPDWPAYLDRFHSERPGITEDLLLQCRDPNGLDPYAWLAESVPDGVTLDLACGSGPMHDRVTGRWVGVDRSTGELTRAVDRGAGPVVLGDALQLPLPTASVSSVVCSMALMLISPVDRALGEIRRVLEPGGTLHVLLPSRRPLRPSDTWRYLRLYVALGSPARFPPSPLTRRAERVLDDAGLTVVSTESRRFGYPLSGPGSARLLVDALYLPGVSDRARERAVAVGAGWKGSELGIALVRLGLRRSEPVSTSPRGLPQVTIGHPMTDEDVRSLGDDG